MKFYELKPTPDNLLNTFLEDTISRDADIFCFIDILNSVEDCCSIALDGNWGCGKTFFVKQIKMIMDAHNKQIVDRDESEQQKIIQKHSKYRLIDEFELQPQISVYYDAWENDNDEEPMLSLVYSIMQSVNADYSFKESPNCLKLGASILELFSGKNFGQVIEKLQSDDPLAVLKKEKDIHKAICEFLDSVMYERGNRLVIFIDELDRCKPEYAVKLLERVKHYFENDCITFVFSINVKELQHTIRRYYGDDFNACKYLDRFFDLCIAMPKADYQKFYASMNFNTHYIYDSVCDAVIRTYHFELREVAKYLRLTRIAAYKPTHGDEYNFCFPEGHGMEFGLMYVVPIMIGLKIHNIDVYEDFVNGKNYKPLLEVFENIEYGFFDELLNKNETFEAPSEAQTQVSLEDKIEELYNAIFCKKYTWTEYCTVVGKCMFNNDTKEMLIRVAGLLSKYTDIADD